MLSFTLFLIDTMSSVIFANLRVFCHRKKLWFEGRLFQHVTMYLELSVTDLEKAMDVLIFILIYMKQ